jgi:uncharacterized membrane protein YgaE (UPF0421/DUF939 family)
VTAVVSRLAREATAARARVRHGIWPVVQTAVAAGLAWYITRDLLGHAQPFFAPIAAAVSLSASNVLRGQRALQLIAGVALGIGIGVGVAAVAEGTVAIGAAVLLAMCAALAVGGGFIGQGLMFVNQTASSAILIIALQQSGSGSERLLDALIGGGVALVISVLLFPAAPLRLLAEATRALGTALREALTQLDEQITRGAPAEPAWLLAATQRIHGALAQLTQARITARRIVRVAPRLWARRATVDAAASRAAQLDLLGNSVLGLLRACQAMLTASEDVPADLRDAIAQLGAAVSGLAEHGLDTSEDATIDLLRRLADRPAPGGASYIPLVTSLINACARDLLRIRGEGNPSQRPGLGV